MTILRATNNKAGFTLIELLVTLAVVGLIMGLAISQVGKSLSWDFKSTSRRLSSTIRYLYNKAATESVTLRLVFDLDEQKYWVEGTSDNFALTKEDEEVVSKKKEAAKPKSKGQDLDAGESIQAKEAVFTQEESTLTKPTTLPRGVFFKDIYAEHQVAPVSSGQAYIYFFPQGYVERSVINLRNRDDDVHYGLKINPLSGSVKIESQYIEPEVQK